MRFFLSLVLSFIILLAAVPAVSLFYKDEILTKNESIVQALEEKEQTAAKEEPAQKKAEKSEEISAAVSTSAKRKSAVVKVLLHAKKEIVTVSREFYIVSVLAKEIDIASPDEALKAQAVCIATFLKRTSAGLSDKDYDITDNPAVHQSFLTEAALKKFWGGSYEKNYKKLQKIVAAVDGQILIFEGKPALAAYHSSNAGTTESAENYWGEAYPYLVAVPSIGDTLCKDYRTEVRFSPKELQKKLVTIKGKSFDFPESPSDWLGETALTPSGTVQTLTIASVPLTGRELREALGLKSSFFETQYQNGEFVFTVSGYGHGVGLSQEGAKYMAKLGFTYEDILLHYYKGVEITRENKV